MAGYLAGVLLQTIQKLFITMNTHTEHTRALCTTDSVSQLYALGVIVPCCVW